MSEQRIKWAVAVRPPVEYITCESRAQAREVRQEQELQGADAVIYHRDDDGYWRKYTDNGRAKKS